MFFNSIDFAIFFPIVFVLYWVFSRNLTSRNILILAASYLFYGWWDYRFLLLIIISSVVDFMVGKMIYQAASKKKKKLLLCISLFINLGFLCYFKYTNFFIDSFINAFGLFGQELNITTLNIILPVGISFYTFQTLSYTIDIYRNQLKPTKNALVFFSFVAFFPQLVAGPIERASHLLPQFYKKHKFNYNNVKTGFLLMSFGHISLSTWFRDYVYFPLGGSRKGKYRTYFNLFIVFIVSGLWHGAAINFLIWGAIHGLIIVIEKFSQKYKTLLYAKLMIDNNTVSYKILFSGITFSIISFAWIFFRANTFNDAMTLISGLVENNYIILFTDQLYQMGLERSELIILMLSIILLLTFEYIHKRKKVTQILQRQPLFFRWFTYVSIVFAIILFGIYGDNDTSQFIYFQF